MAKKAEPALPLRGAPRKRRRMRINQSGAVGAIPAFAPSEAEWKQLTMAYGVPLGDEDRTAITRAITEYFDWAVFEPASPFLDDSIRWLDTARKSGDRVWRHLFTETGPDPLKGDAYFHAKTALDTELREIGASPTEEIISSMTAFMAASVKARARMIADAKKNGFREGDAWADMIVDLTASMKGAGLPVTVNKAVDKAAHWKPSPFVTFVQALQMLFPSDFRRHMASAVALSEAITISRRSKRKIKSASRAS
jgi:hypothetical protein